MEGLKLKKGTKCNTLGGGVSRLGTLFGVAAMLVLATGCPQVGGGGEAGPECTADTVAADCTAGEPCQTATCTDDGTCEYAFPEGCDADHCIDDACVACIADDECDDSNECTDDACTDNACVNTNNTAACDDGDACTEGDACTAGACAGTDIPGCCQSDTDCANGETCNTESGLCEPEVPAADDLSADNPGVTFGDLSVGATEALTAPLPEGANPRQVGANCDECSWSVDPGTAASFDPSDACTTDMTVLEPGVFTISVEVTCDDGFTESFSQGAVATEPTEVPCDDAGDCDDGDLCTVDSCVNNVCENTAVDVDDGSFCNGVETCDPDTGDPVSPGDPCSDPTPNCNEDTDTCEEAPVCEVSDCASPGVCTNNVCVGGDDDGKACCSDGIFCNGIETCDTDTGNCIAGDRPCDDNNGAGCDDPDGLATQSCEEGDTGEVCTACPSETQDFTLDTDNLTGTINDDTFDAPLIFNPGTGALIATLQTGDKATGLAGADVLDAQVNGGNIVPSTIDGIETFNITSFTATTLDATNISGVDTIISSGSTADLTVTALQELVDFGFSNVNNTAVDFTLEFALASTTNASNDEITLSIGSTAGVATIQTAVGSTNGFETLNIVSSGTEDNTLTTLTQSNGTSINTVNISGTGKFTLTNALDGSIANLSTVNAAASTGGVNLTFGATRNLTVTGGTGDDFFNFGTTFNSGATSKDTVDGGDGTDTVVALLNTSQTTGAALTAIEKLRIEGDDDGNAETFTFALNNVSGLHTIELESQGTGLTADTLTLSQMPYPTTTTPTLRLRGDGNDQNQLFDGLVFSFAGASGSGDDLLAIVFDNREGESPAGTALTRVDGTTERAVTVANIGIDNIEDLTITNTKGNLTFTAFDASQLEDLTVTSEGDVALGTIDSTAVDRIDASGCTEDFSFNVGSTTQGVTVTGAVKDNTITTGTGADTITTGAGDDTITSGDGTDTVIAGAGDDIVTTDAAGTSADADTVDLGAGDDVLRVFGCNDASTNADVVTGFTAGANNDQLELDGSELETASAIDSGVTVNLIQFGGTNLTASSAAVDIQECTVGGGACDVASAAANVVVMVGGNITTTALLATALETGGAESLTINAGDATQYDGFIVVYDDGTDAFLALCYDNTGSGGTSYGAGELTCFNLVELDGFGDITAGDFDTSNFDWIQ